MDPEILAMYNQGIEQFTVPLFTAIAILYVIVMYQEYKGNNPQ